MKKEIKLTYSLKGVERVMRDLIEWAQLTTDQNFPAHFVKKHPWAFKYLGEQPTCLWFKKLVDDSDMVWGVCRDSVLETNQNGSGTPENIKVYVSVGSPKEASIASIFYFCFHQIEPGRYEFSHFSTG